jgi:hypothetical protein
LCWDGDWKVLWILKECRWACLYWVVTIFVWIYRLFGILLKSKICSSAIIGSSAFKKLNYFLIWAYYINWTYIEKENFLGILLWHSVLYPLYFWPSLRKKKEEFNFIKYFICLKMLQVHERWYLGTELGMNLFQNKKFIFHIDTKNADNFMTSNNVLWISTLHWWYIKISLVPLFINVSESHFYHLVLSVLCPWSKYGLYFFIWKRKTALDSQQTYMQSGPQYSVV